ncbi:hypothetical protein [Sphingomonas sp. BK235]|uniref:hypothetical protein n=1 Tax=Sphingomonas sp. BK235 TaxID=2512131 RepID=UPI00104D6C4E|nr:hypothetical protein [Sphingomonas sp. BK235]TCP30072.1 hypothetical protein EV292_11416 [Sphingomonas sp. BK235]
MLLPPVNAIGKGYLRLANSLSGKLMQEMAKRRYGSRRSFVVDPAIFDRRRQSATTDQGASV